MAALEAHALVSHVSDFTEELDEAGIRFRLDGREVDIEVKAKGQQYGSEYLALWAEVPEADLFILDELSYRRRAGKDSGLCSSMIGRPADGMSSDRGALSRAPPTVPASRRPWRRRVLEGKASPRPADLGCDDGRSLHRRPRRGDPRQLARPHASGGSPGSRACPAPARAEGTRTCRRGLHLTRLEPVPDVAVEVDADPTWCGLAPDLVDRVKSAFGWRAPTDVQRLAFPPILRGENVLVLAPTAGGKTEAGLLPMLDRYRSAAGRAPVVLAVSPLKALLDDQLVRYQRLAGLLGFTAFAWHGDVAWDDKRQFLDNPSTILLTTPESLETLLTSPQRDHVRLFAGLQAVVVDEVHAFAGTPRGRGAGKPSRADRPVRRRRSAAGRLLLTVGNPEEVLAWMRGV